LQAFYTLLIDYQIKSTYQHAFGNPQQPIRSLKLPMKGIRQASGYAQVNNNLRSSPMWMLPLFIF
jgi:hypothetical protein